MLTNLEVFTPTVLTPPLPYVDQPAALDVIQIKNIDGLGPVKTNVNTDQYGSVDGEILTGTQTPKRNIVITVKLNPNWATTSIESLRMLLYSYFMPQSSVRLRFSSTHMPTVEISGVVESCEPNIFAKDPEYQISIICPLPNFVAVDQTIVTGTSLALTDPAEAQVFYQGSVPTGFIFQLGPGLSSTPVDARLINRYGGNTTELMIASALALPSNYFLETSTQQGNMYATLINVDTSQQPTNYLNKIAPGSNWWNLQQGKNRIQVLTSTVGIPWRILYYAKYGGL